LEMPGYPIATSRPYPGRLVIIEDEDGDGVFEKRTVFAGDFRYADSILPYKGGVLVADPPNLVYLKDTNGDKVADVRENWLSGFTVGNAQHNVCGLTIGLDNWIYIANGGNSGAVYLPDHPEKKLPISGQNLRFYPDGKIIETTAESSGGYGLGMDKYGRFFGTHNTEHISASMFFERYLARNPHLAWPGTMVRISDHSEGDLARVFPIGVPQTRMNHPEQSGYFSAAAGITCYEGGAFPAEYNGNIFLGDVVTNLVHRDVITPQSCGYRASRGRGEARKEFLASTDPDFRPVNVKTGPDAALYVVDFHRAVIEHPEWIPDEIEKKLDLRKGEFEGRIFRIVPQSGLPRSFPHCSRAKLDQTVGALSSGNKWHRDTAQRLLVEWNDPASVARLENLFKSSKNPLARLHAMWTLDGMGKLNDQIVLAALKDKEPGVRENAAKLAESRMESSKELSLAVIALMDDPDARTRLQGILSGSAFLYGTHDEELLQAAQSALARRAAGKDTEDEWMRNAVLSGLGERPMPIFRFLCARGRQQGHRARRGELDLFRSVCETVGARKDRAEIGEALGSLHNQGWDRESRAALIEGIAEGLDREGARDWMQQPKPEIEEAMNPLVEDPDPRVLRAAWKISGSLGLPIGEGQQRMLDRALEIARDTSADPQERIEELDLLEFTEFGAREEFLFSLLNIQQPVELQMAAIEQLARGPNDRVAPRLMAIWKQLGPETRRKAGNILLYRKENQEMLLTALENKEIPIGQMNFDLERRRALLFSMNQDVRKRASALFTDAGVVTRGEALEKMKPALGLKGDPAKGHETWKNLCSKCHVIGKEGHAVGPNLTDIFRKSGQTLLEDIVDPNAAVATEHIGYTIVTKKGATLSGLLRAQSASSVTVREGGGKDTLIPRSEIREMYASGLSLMPEELEKDMAPQTMADLISFLQQPR
ncbi:c-type cytochrome, partial [Candidatus Sumerlaeota bacterium]|nr:c-type cytochrome [Candidatus Sumerlaeota bacterium]